jgi:hypothetical protein
VGQSAYGVKSTFPPAGACHNGGVFETPGYPLTIAWVAAAVAALLVHRSATARRARLGEPPAGLAPLAWAIIVLVLGLIGLLLYGLAVLGQDRRRTGGSG